MNNACRMRVRANDVFLGIESVGRSWAIEDISVNVNDCGPVRAAPVAGGSGTIGRR